MSVNRQPDQKKKSDPRKEKSRGTQNELEIIAQIIAELPHLRDSVLRRLAPTLDRKGRTAESKPEGAPRDGDKK